MEYWAYMLYAPLYMHGPCMQFRHFRVSPASALRVSQASVHGLDKTEKPSQPFVLSQVAQRVSLTLGRLSVGLKDLIGMLAIIAAICFAMQTFYMPTIFFLKIHEAKVDSDPMNLEAPEYFVLYCLFTLAVFLQSYVVFGICRALALMDGVDAPKDVLASFLRSSVSVHTHWNNFHASWRQFFFRYIVMPHKESFQEGYAFIDFTVFMFSAFLHSEPVWVFFFLYNFVMYQVEKLVLFKWRRFKREDPLVRGVYQSVLVAANTLFFPALTLYEVEKGQVMYSNLGPQYFCFFGLFFCYLNCIRIKNSPNSFI